MPFTPYHFGPSGLIGLTLRKWLDVPVFVLANVIVDLEVMVIYFLGVGWPIHRYIHTLLIGAAAGMIWALVAWQMRNVFKKIMHILCIHYQTSFLKMLVSGILGVWLHVIIDSIYHWDVRVFWPSKVKPLYKLVTTQQVEMICAILFIWALILYIMIVIKSLKKNRFASKIGNQEER
ncbi:MAG: hypothetical protein ACYSUY_11625 [Planctomycetota bacterium]|jgi:membrane-bound metal-dependent hydrolase YbcI (DUF457 family)